LLTKLIRRSSSEEQELADKQRELSFLLSRLVDRELQIADLKTQLANFEGRYLQQVGVLYAELDEWNARVAELIAHVQLTTEARSAAIDARKQVNETDAAIHSKAPTIATHEVSPALRRLWREVLKVIHPDRASGEADRLLRDRLSKEASNAYSRRDIEALRRIMEEYKNSPESVCGEGVSFELERVILQIKQISTKLMVIDSEITRLSMSDLALLMAKVQTSSNLDFDFLIGMARDVQDQIDAARQQLEILTSATRRQ